MPALLVLLFIAPVALEAQFLTISVDAIDSLYFPPRDSVLQRIQRITEFDSYLRRQQLHKALIAYARIHALQEELGILRRQLTNLQLIHGVLVEKQKRSEVADVEVIQHEQQLLGKKIAIAGHIYQIKEVILTLCQLANIEIKLTENETMSKHSLPKFLTQSEKEILYSAARDPRDRCLISLGLNAGMRVSELIGLKLDDIDWENAQIRFTAKGGKERLIPLNLRLRIDLSTAIEHRPAELGHNFVIWNKRDSARNISRFAVYNLLRRYGQRLGLKKRLHPHMLRHTAATDFYRSCGDIYQTQRFLGHSKIDTTTRYAQVSDKEIQTTLQTVNRPNWLVRLLAKFRAFPPQWLLHKPASSRSFFTGTVGRQKEIALLRQNMERGISTVVIGERGSGKSHLLRLLGENES
jgi:site-specific recombinase XerC